MANTYQSAHTGTTIDNTISYLQTPSTMLTLGTAWTGTVPPYTQTVSCGGVSASMVIIIGELDLLYLILKTIRQMVDMLIIQDVIENVLLRKEQIIQK